LDGLSNLTRLKSLLLGGANGLPTDLNLNGLGNLKCLEVSKDWRGGDVGDVVGWF